jgi:hypothetical protein
MTLRLELAQDPRDAFLLHGIATDHARKRCDRMRKKKLSRVVSLGHL